jgi:hypothetical protein
LKNATVDEIEFSEEESFEWNKKVRN